MPEPLGTGTDPTGGEPAAIPNHETPPTVVPAKEISPLPFSPHFFGDIPEHDDAIRSIIREIFTKERDYLMASVDNEIIDTSIWKIRCERCHFLRLDDCTMLSLPQTEEMRKHWARFYSTSPEEWGEKFRTIHPKFDLKRLFEIAPDSDKVPEYVEWSYWELTTITSLITFVLHELHPVGVQFFCWYGPTSVEGLVEGLAVCRRLHSSVRFLIVLSTTNDHYCHYVIDVARGTCNIFDPNEDAVMETHKQVIWSW
jgi:hypothetical protein